MKHLIVIVILNLLGLLAFGQSTAGLLECDVPIPVEEVRLHTDRSRYIAGETVWFSAHGLLDGQLSSRLSKVLYVELYDARRQAHVQQKVALQDGMAEGSFAIPEELPSGNYFLRAYTQYMRNFPPEHYANRVVSILNPAVPAAEIELPERAPVEFSFAAGAPVAELPAPFLVRFEPDLTRSGADVWLQDAAGNRMAAAEALHQGVALFRLTPRTGTRYLVKIRTASGDTLSHFLPPTVEAGLTCLYRSAGDQSAQITLRATAAFVRNHTPAISTLIIAEDGRLLHHAPGTLQGGEHQMTVSTGGWPAGLHYVVIEASNGKTLQVQPFYHRTKAVAPIDIELSRHLYTQRQSVELILNAPAAGSISVAVRYLGAGPGEGVLPMHLVDNPWLAATYLDDHAVDKSTEDLLLLLLADQVKKQERFAGPSAAPPTLKYVPEIHGLTVSGVVRDRETKEPLANVLSMVAVVGEGEQLHLDGTRGDGSFLFPLAGLAGPQTLYLGMRRGRESNAELLVNSDFSTDFPVLTPVPPRFDTAGHRHWEVLYRNAQLARRYAPTDTTSAALPRPLPFNLGAPDYGIDLASYIRIPTMLEIFTELVPHVRVQGRTGERYLTVFNEATQQRYEDPLVLLDNIPIYDIDALLSIDPALIERIDVINNNYLLGDYLFGGVISITTHTTNFAGYPWPRETVFLDFAAVEPPRPFEIPAPAAAPRPDFRSVLYWVPNRTTSSGGEPVQFPASDQTGDYEVIVKGVTQDGRPCEGRAVFTVERGAGH